ncbi:MAG: effector-associated domain EAD1-containing protein [Cyanobacteria bacterium P01_D01_bin.50]
MSMIDGTLREKICEALQDAFPNYTDIEQMLSFKFNENLESISGKNGLKTVVFKLVQKYESQGNLDELIIAAIRENPGNPELQKLVQEIDKIQCEINPDDSKDFNDLLPIIKKNDFDIIEKILYQTLSYLDENPLKAIENKFKDLKQIQNEESRTSIQLFLLKKILIYEYKKLRDFSQNLDNHEQLNNSSQSNEEINSYLLVLVKPEERNQYRINAYLIPNEEDKDNVEPLDIKNEEKGVLCTFDEIKYQIPQFRQQAEKRIQQKTNNKYKLNIEFFLPWNYLNENVEQWNTSYNDKLEPDTCIGERYTVVVRSYDRLQRPEWIGALRDRIDELQKVRGLYLNEQIVKDRFEHLQELNNLNQKELRNKLSTKKIGLKLSCPPPPVSHKTYKNLFIAILSSGIPIAIWKRSSSIPNMNSEDEFNNILNVNSLSKSSNLFELILKERKLAYQEEECENYFGYDLGVLCEEPNLEEFSYLKDALDNL